ncbi:MAG: GDP-mannose 4,6-dehydratase, partial [Anaeroplasmataceae bacterium]|nr:GDP-mannose 4,6-dehydratase [Anaeroplasmataceae bacterium]
VINFAAETHVDRSIQSSEIFLETNVKGTHTLLEISRIYKIKRFHQISTDEVYGDLRTGETPFTENSILRPSNPYAATKASADMLIMSYARTYNLPCSISRCSNNYGPYQNSEKFIPMIICNASNNKAIPIYGDGLNIRNWIYVLDHCTAIDLIVRQGMPGNIYNISGDEEIANYDLSKLILKQLEKDDSLLISVCDRLGHDYRYAIDSSKIKQEFNWNPQYSLAIGLQKTIEWYKRNLK